MAVGLNVKKITRVGDSSCVILPKELLRCHFLQRGDEVLLYSLPNGDIGIRKIPERFREEIIKA